MKESLIVNQVWHKTAFELPEETREVLGLTYIDKDSDKGDRFSIMSEMFYFRKGTVLKVEPDRKIQWEYPGKRERTAEEKLLSAIFGDDDDLQEIEADGWYTFDSLNEAGLLRYRRINDGPVYWCYLVPPDGIEMNFKARVYTRDKA